MTISRSLLIASLDDLSTPHFLAPVISAAASSTRSRLLIVLFSPLFGLHAISHTEHWDDVQRLLTFVYVQATKVAQDMNKILMNIDVLLKGTGERLGDDICEDMEVVYRVQGENVQVELPLSVRELPQVIVSPAPRSPHLYAQPEPSTGPPLVPPGVHPPLYAVIALGGTFDHLHAGHKILLSMGAWITSRKIIVGVTDDGLLKGKSNKDLLEPLTTRTSRVRAFLSIFRPDITYDVVPINDVYGPTGWDPNIQALVVSKETMGGAASIAKHRAAHNLPSLQVFIIDVISPDNSRLDHDDAEMLKQTKMSSTFIREWIARHRREEEEDEESNV